MHIRCVNMFNFHEPRRKLEVRSRGRTTGCIKGVWQLRRRDGVRGSVGSSVMNLAIRMVPTPLWIIRYEEIRNFCGCSVYCMGPP